MKIESIILSAGIALAGFFISNSIVEFKKDRTIEVRGLSERDVVATEGSWTLQFRATAPDVITLNKAVSSAQSAIRAFLEREGFPRDSIRPSSVTVSDNSQYNQSYDKDSRYSATGSLVVVSNDVKKIAESSTRTESLLASGVMLESSNTRFSFTGLNDIKTEMLKLATNNARDAALSLARDSDMSLGKVRSASQGLFTISTPGAEWEDPSSINKRVRVVTRVVFDIR
jgi:hypothetical protein